MPLYLKEGFKKYLADNGLADLDKFDAKYMYEFYEKAKILKQVINMSFKMPTGKELAQMIDQLSEHDKKEIAAQFKKDALKEDKINQNLTK